MVSIVVHDIRVSYDSYEALKGVTFEIHPGEVVSVIGPNGSGKTTLLKTLDGILRPYKGSVYIDGKNIEEYTRREIAKIMSFVPQRFDAPWSMSVFEFALTGRRPFADYNYSKYDLKRTYQVLVSLDCAGLVNKRLDQISGGELQRVLIARALVSDPRIIILDEPVANLDPKHQVEILSILRKLAMTENRTVVMSLHDLTLAYRYSNKIIALKNGRVAAVGEPDEVITEERIKEIFEVEIIVLRDHRAVIVRPCIHDLIACSSTAR